MTDSKRNYYYDVESERVHEISELESLVEFNL